MDKTTPEAEAYELQPLQSDTEVAESPKIPLNKNLYAIYSKRAAIMIVTLAVFNFIMSLVIICQVATIQNIGKSIAQSRN
ncbi:hypothetical protein MOSE0_F07492 [Monosporozyma servazzii]